MSKTKQRNQKHTKYRAQTHTGASLKPWFPANTYIAHTMPGLEEIAWREVRRKLPSARLIGSGSMAKQNGLLFFRYSDNPAALLKLRVVEDIFFVVASLAKMPGGRGGLYALSEIMAQQANWSLALKKHRDATGYIPKRGNQTTYRVISRIDGHQPFHRKEAQARIEQTVQKVNSRWVRVADEAILELWLNIFDRNEVVVGLRLSDQTLRHRPYQQETLPASLRASVAATMVMLSDPQDDDIFLDPMCGSGTILIERALWGPHQQLLGGDIRTEAVAVAQHNIDNKYSPIQVSEWDATQLRSVADQSIDCVVCNLPFGKQIGSREKNVKLYQAFVDEMARVLKPEGRLVLLSGDGQRLRQALQQSKAFRISETVSFQLLGVQALIFVGQRN